MRRSRSPRRRPEQMEEAFSISSLSDVSAGELIDRRDASKRFNRKFESRRRRKDSYVSDKRPKSEHSQYEESMHNFQNNPDMFSDPSIFEYQPPSFRPPSPRSHTNGRNDERRSVDERGKKKFEDRGYKRSTSDRHDWESKAEKDRGDKRSFDERNDYKDRRQSDGQSGSKRGESKLLNHDKKSSEGGSSKSDDRIDRLERMLELLVKSKSQVDSLHQSNLEIEHKNTKVSTSFWLNKINEYCLERNYDEATCIKYIQTKMSGLMKAWFKTLNTSQYTWPELKMLITKTFPDTFDFASTLRLLVNRIKLPDETITEYYFTKMYLIEYCKISGVNAVSCLIDGLDDPYLQKQAKECNFLTPETLYSQFLVNIPNYGLSNQLVEPERQIKLEYTERDDVYSQPITERIKPAKDVTKKKCYTCGKFGHIAEACRHAPICYHCRERGHIAAKCPNV